MNTIALFPYDVYKNENEVKNYTAGDKVFDKTDSTNSQLVISFLVYHLELAGIK